MSIIGNFIGFRAYYQHSKGNNEKALELYAQAKEKNMSRPNFLLAYGVLLLRTGNYNKSKEILTELLSRESLPVKVKYYAKMNLALAYWKLDDIKTAVEMMEDVHNNLKDTNSYQTYGYLLIESGDIAKAFDFNLKALDYDDTDPVILDNLGLNYYRMGDIDNALKYFLKAEKIKPDQSDTLYHLGCIYLERNDFDRAEDMFNKALKYNTHALCTVSNSQIEDKLKELKEARLEIRNNSTN